jgi:hypothetical protein
MIGSVSSMISSAGLTVGDKASEQQQQTTTNQTKMNNRLTYFGVDHARIKKKITHPAADIGDRMEGEITNDKK